MASMALTPKSGCRVHDSPGSLSGWQRATGVRSQCVTSRPSGRHAANALDEPALYRAMFDTAPGLEHSNASGRTFQASPSLAPEPPPRHVH